MPSERTDAVELCAWMEKMPSSGPFDFRPWRGASPEGWWGAAKAKAGCTLPADNEWHPRELTLNECRLIEEKLSAEQWGAYFEWFSVRHPRTEGFAKFLLHADVPTKLAALAEVIRSTR